MSDETIVRLKITGTNRPPEQISKAIGLTCDRSWRIGDKRENTVIVEKTNGWVLNSGLPKTASLEAHIEDLLKRLLAHADKLRLLSEDECTELSCVVYAASPPALNFDKTVIQRLSDLGVSLDIDLYLTGGEND
jgi:hypothetical protein